MFKPAKCYLQIELIKPKPQGGQPINENAREEFADVVSVGEETTIKAGTRVFFKLYNVFKFVEGKKEYNLIAEENILATK
jgi:co-chaperonin GroES (HSP10)